VKRTDPVHWKAWTECNDAAASVERPARRQQNCEGLIPRLRKQTAKETAGQVMKELWDKLKSKQLAGFGKYEDEESAEHLVHVSHEAWPVVVNWSKSIIKERSTTQKLYGVRIFPLIHSPDAASRLFGCSLAQAFHRFVILDPEIAEWLGPDGMEMLGRLGLIDDKIVDRLCKAYVAGALPDRELAAARLASAQVQK